MSRPRFSIRFRRQAAVLFALALGLGACGRTLPTDPTGAVVARHIDTRGVRARSDGLEDIELEVVVSLAQGVDAREVAADHLATLVDWELEERCAKFLPPSGMTRESLVAILASDSRCQSVDLNEYLETSESRQQSFAFDDGIAGAEAYMEQDAARALHLASAHFVSRGRGVPIAIIDTGVDAAHPAISGRILAGHDFVDDDLDPAEFADGIDQDADGNVDEAYGHGTHVAGIIALTAPHAPLLVARVLDADGRGDVLDVASGIRWAIRHGARVINLSLGTVRSIDAIQDALEEAEEMGIVVVCSAGNWGAEEPGEFPARSSHAHAVAATDVAGRPAPFTSFGEHVALSAPGIAVRSAYPGGRYRLWSGTSMSAPFVAGAAALVIERNPSMTPEQVMGRLRGASRPILAPRPDQVGRMGHGMLDVLASVRADLSGGASGDDRPRFEEGR